MTSDEPAISAPGEPSAPKVAAMGVRATKSAAWVGGSQFMRVITTLLSTIVVARILKPDDYGVIAMTTPVTAFILLFQDLGLSQSVIQARVVPPQALNGLFWINILASTLIMAVLILISPLVALFYGDARVGYVTAASAIAVLISGSMLQHSALMTRDMRFRALSMVDVSSAVTILIVTILAALVLRSYWALWFGTLCGTLVQASLLWRLDKWRPSFPISFAGTRSMVHFGGGLTGFNLVNFVLRNLDNVLIARFAGSSALGLYDRSYRLMMGPLQAVNSPLGRVMMPVLSRLQDEPERYRRTFLFAARGLLLVLTPGLAVIAALSMPLIPFLLGARWAAAGPIFFWLSLTGLLQPLPNATGWLFLSSGRTQSMFRWGLLSLVITVTGFVIGLRWGAVGVAASLFWTALVRLPILFPWCVRGTSVKTIDLYLVLLEPAVITAVTMGLTFLIAPYLPVWASLAIAIPCSYIVGVAAYAMTPAGRHFLAALRSLGSRLLRERLPKLFGTARAQARS